MLYAGMGGYAERVLAQANLMVPLDGVTDRLGPATVVAGLGHLTTAYVALTEVAPLRGDMAVLVHGAAGGLGSAFGQVARALGAGQVVGTVGSPGKAEYARSLGFDPVLTTGDNLEDEARRVAGERGGFDLVVDPIRGRFQKPVREGLLCWTREPSRYLIEIA